MRSGIEVGSDKEYLTYEFMRESSEEREREQRDRTNFLVTSSVLLISPPPSLVSSVVVGVF